MEIGKRDIEFLGYKISKGHVILQEHVLKVFVHFPNQILEKVQLHIFLDTDLCLKEMKEQINNHNQRYFTKIT